MRQTPIVETAESSGSEAVPPLEQSRHALMAPDPARRMHKEASFSASQASIADAERIAQFGSWELDLNQLIDVDANPLHWSDEMFRIAGYEPGAIEVSNELFFSLVHPEDREPIQVAIAAAILERRPYSVVHRLIRPDGEERILEERAQIRFSEVTGQPVQVIGTAHDITGRSRAEAQKRGEEERYVRQRNALISFAGGGTKGSEGLTTMMRRLTETGAAALGVARVSIWRYNADRSSIRCVDLYEREEGRHSTGFELSAADYPQYFKALALGNVIAAEEVHSDERTLEFSETYLRPLGISSMLDAPIHLGGETDGVLCCEHIGEQHRWTADEQTFAVAVANVASLALEGMERQRAEEQSRESEGRYRAVVEWSPEAMIVYRGVQVLFVNPAAVRMFGGITSQDLLGKSVLDLVHPDFQAHMASRVGNQSPPGGHKPLMEERMLKLDGTAIEVEVQRASISFGGEPAILASMHDITARKHTERDLQRSQALLRMAGRIGRMGAWSVELPECKLTWSEEVCSIHGMPPGSTPTMEEAVSYYAPEFRASSEHAFKTCVLKGTPYDLELQILTAGGRRVWVRSLGEAERDTLGVIRRVQGNIQDITARKEAETALGKAHQELVGASRRAGMAEVATSVIHNVGNVLNSVNISAGLVADRVKNFGSSSLVKVVALLHEHEHDLAGFITRDSRGKHLPDHLARLSEHQLAEQKAVISELELLRGNVDHIKQIVAMQQNYATAGGVREFFSVVDLVEDSIRITETSLKRHSVEVAREFAAVPHLFGEKHKIVQILVNLLRNAKHACQESTQQNKRLTVRVSAGENTVKIMVIDNGVGISPENLANIYNYGFTTRKHGHGFGLHSGALAAKEMGGSLTAQSAGPGMGSAFMLELPCPSPETPHE